MSKEENKKLLTAINQATVPAATPTTKKLFGDVQGENAAAIMTKKKESNIDALMRGEKHMINSKVNHDLLQTFRAHARSRGKRIQHLITELLCDFFADEERNQAELISPCAQDAPVCPLSVRLPVSVRQELIDFTKENGLTTRLVLEVILSDYVIEKNKTMQIKLF